MRQKEKNPRYHKTSCCCPLLPGYKSGQDPYTLEGGNHNPGKREVHTCQRKVCRDSECLTQWRYKGKVLQHHIEIQASLSLTKKVPFCPWEIHGDILKCHNNLSELIQMNWNSLRPHNPTVPHDQPTHEPPVQRRHQPLVTELPAVSSSLINHSHPLQQRQAGWE